MMLREMTTSYGRSPIGYLWEILQPVAGIALLTLVFSVMLASPPIGKSFVLFYTTGIVPFMAYQAINTKVAQSISFSKQLLVYPSVTVFDAIAARFTLNFLTQLLVGFLLFTGVLVFEETRTSMHLPTIFLGVLMLGAFALGLGTLNCFLFGILPGWQRVWAVLNRPMFLVSGILFLFEHIPEPYRSWMWWNPITHIVGQVRRGFYPFYDAAWVSPAYVFIVSLVCMAVGVVFLIRYTLDIINN
ncbi:Surface protein [Candidatus Rhodobacter oscarellae]|uniref:Transport permease protein n=2 Tax=Candidatus Rhodobacter oscarellae TaxID=1675527 RepID=A0A0J9EB23_9RHOB|nr:Surface protein [Candidatus Rhodobacter lobularis]